MTVEPGTVVGGDFRIIRKLAQGGMGAVYIAEQLSTGRQRALKLMKPELVTDPKSHRRFVDEAKVGSRINSEHVVEVVAAGFDAELGAPWLAMELLEGDDLEDYVRKSGPLALDEVAGLFEQAAHALGRAHEIGVIHRDLKPENMFLARPSRVGAEPVLKILDFGIAAFVAGDKTAATVTTAIGSPLWMAPEQLAAGAKLRPSTDVFALGLIAFYLLTGKSYWRSVHAEPFNLHALIAEIVAQPLVSASVRAAELGAKVPEGFDGWFAQCVARKPSERLRTASEVATALASLAIASASTQHQLPAPAAEGHPVPKPLPRTQVVERGGEPRGRSPWPRWVRLFAALVGGLGMALGLVGVGLALLEDTGNAEVVPRTPEATSGQPRSVEDAPDAAQGVSFDAGSLLVPPPVSA